MINFDFADGTWDGVRISSDEALLMVRFIHNHEKCRRDISIMVSSGGIGQNVVVACEAHAKGSQTDITDYASW
jgi:hypothetical protein